MNEMSREVTDKIVNDKRRLKEGKEENKIKGEDVDILNMI